MGLALGTFFSILVPRYLHIGDIIHTYMAALYIFLVMFHLTRLIFWIIVLNMRRIARNFIYYEMYLIYTRILHAFQISLVMATVSDVCCDLFVLHFLCLVVIFHHVNYRCVYFYLFTMTSAVSYKAVFDEGYRKYTIGGILAKIGYILRPGVIKSVSL